MKVAVIGTGNVAERNYLPCLAKQQDVELSLFGRTPAKAEACAAKCGGRVASSVEDLMAGSPDTVFILTREMLFSFEGGRFTLRDLDGDTEVLDYAGNSHETFALARQTSRWEQYGLSFDRSIEASLDSIRNGTPPPVPGMAGLQELQFEAALKRSAQLNRPVKVQEEFPLT